MSGGFRLAELPGQAAIEKELVERGYARDNPNLVRVRSSIKTQRGEIGELALDRRMTNMPDEDLQYLVHFFTDKEHLFKTITMAEARRVDEICDRFVSQKGWYWGRYAQSERQAYLTRRRFVEKELFDGYTRAYGRLKEKVPVYFYLYPKITTRKALALGQQRTRHAEAEPGLLMVRIRDIEEFTNLTFTLNDSLTAYRQKAIQAGIECRGPQPAGIMLPDHNKVFPFALIEEIHRKYTEHDLVYEVQVWDYELLERIRYTIPGEEKA